MNDPDPFASFMKMAAVLYENYDNFDAEVEAGNSAGDLVLEFAEQALQKAKYPLSKKRKMNEEQAKYGEIQLIFNLKN